MTMRLWMMLLGLGMASCHVPKSDSSNKAEPIDTLQLLASRLFESHTYEQFIARANPEAHVRWIDASLLSDHELKIAFSRCDGLLLTGGADIHPNRYGRPADTARCGFIDLERDALEARLLEMADHSDVPVLGICRGMQFMNVHSGGTLHAHLPEVIGSDLHRGGVEGNSWDTLHSVVVSRNMPLLSLQGGEQSQVTSHHHQGIDDLAPKLIAWAIAEDSLIEAVMHVDVEKHPFYVGVQWHPERSPIEQALVEPLALQFIAAMQARQKSIR